MSGFRPGDPLILTCLLADGNPSKFIRCTVQDSANLPIAGSPFNLVYVGLGIYQWKSPTLTFPDNTFELRAVYEVYNDPMYLQKSNYLNSMDILRFQNVLATSEITAIQKQREMEAMAINNGRNSAISVNIDY